WGSHCFRCIKVTERAHAAVAAAVRRGELAKPSRCGRCKRASRRIVGHHHDYAAELDVEWLCESCHGIAHSQLRAHRVSPHRNSRLAYIPEEYGFVDMKPKPWSLFGCGTRVGADGIMGRCVYASVTRT